VLAAPLGWSRQCTAIMAYTIYGHSAIHGQIGRQPRDHGRRYSAPFTPRSRAAQTNIHHTYTCRRTCEQTSFRVIAFIADFIASQQTQLESRVWYIAIPNTLLHMYDGDQFHPFASTRAGAGAGAGGVVAETACNFNRYISASLMRRKPNSVRAQQMRELMTDATPC